MTNQFADKNIINQYTITQYRKSYKKKKVIVLVSMAINVGYEIKKQILLFVRPHDLIELFIAFLKQSFYLNVLSHSL